LAFILVGFQLKPIVARIDLETGRSYAIVAALLTLTAIAARILWVTLAAGWSRRRRPRAHGTAGPRDPVALSPKGAAVVGWCGMRGAVTLAAALALPTGGADGGQPYPFRDLILVTAFGVVLGTLVIQGLTLRPLMLKLGLEDDGAVEHETQHARLESLRAAMAAVANAPPAPTTELVRHRYELQLKQAEAVAQGGLMETAGGSTIRAATSADAEVVRAATEAQRSRLIALRNDGTIGDAAFQVIQEELDWAELDWQQFLRGGSAE
ncbi:MAG TPA: cation:proton antiporter, partial [Gemmatimonadales bacterium]|nr:cation:proton antiporter [Gemmatimonadales bacterium]